MAGKSVADDGKIMDVSRPGKGKIVTNSRSITAPIVSDNAASGDVTETTAETAPVPVAPSAARKVIKPISIDDQDGDDTIVVGTGESEKTGADSTQESENAEPETIEPKPESNAEDPAEAAKETAAPETTDSLPTPRSDPDNPIAPPEPATDQSGAASVDELAKAAEHKRLDAEKAREQAERDKNIQSLTKSKQYFVPIKHSVKAGKGKRWLIGLLILIIVLAGAYLTLDAKLIDNSIKLPFELIKEDEPQPEAQDSNLSGVETDPAKPGDDEDKKPEFEGQTDPGNTATTPEDLAADDERKNEIKSLQQALEAYFGDNDGYPVTLDGLSPAPTADDLADPAGKPYVYTPSPAACDGEAVSCDTYSLSAMLSDGTAYTVKSVNQ